MCALHKCFCLIEWGKDHICEYHAKPALLTFMPVSPALPVKQEKCSPTSFQGLKKIIVSI